MILIALGSNLPSRFGPPEQTLEAAKRALELRGIKIRQSSQTILTEPVPVSDQPWYANAVVEVQTLYGLRHLFEILKQIEVAFGRTETHRNASRVLDMDLIAYGQEIYEAPDLLVPHPRMYDRGFVLYPLQEIAPEWVHPVLNKTLHDLIQDLPEDQQIKPAVKDAA